MHHEVAGKISVQTRYDLIYISKDYSGYSGEWTAGRQLMSTERPVRINAHLSKGERMVTWIAVLESSGWTRAHCKD